MNKPLTEQELLALKGTNVAVFFDVMSDFIDEELKPSWVTVDELLENNVTLAELMQVGDFYMKEVL